MNCVIMIGNLTRDPDLRYSAGNNRIPYCRFTLAVNEGYGEKQRTSFVQIVAFNKTAENCSNYLSKGQRVAIHGRIQTGRFEKDGRTVYTTEVVADRVEFLGGKQGQGDTAPGNNVQVSPQMAEPEYQESEMIYEPDGFSYINDDDIPY